ncbi:MAG: protease HtpX [Gammaproteobacteria bacterium]
MLRIVLFLITNLAVMLLLGIVVKLFGVEAYLAGQGMNLNGLLIMAGVFGMGGSIISLLISKWTAKRVLGLHVIEQPRDGAETWLLDTVTRQAQEAGVGVPEVAIYDSPDLNAFATGANRNHALIAVSTGLLQRMRREEVEAVLGHEMSHVANGDMVTLALIQGVVNTFVFFLSRVIGQLVDRAVFRNERGHGVGFWITTMIAQMVLGVLAMIIVMWFSRRREFRADSGGAKLAGRDKMIRALERLGAAVQQDPMPEQIQAFGIAGKPSGLARLFMSHPPIEERIAALRALYT